jgi:predicted GIY-YIG superfamily endonuclease
MISIYCIEDINDMKYIGMTTQTLAKRMYGHIHKQHQKKKCSSSNLILENSIIYLLEECEESISKEREIYWIRNTDCVNVQGKKEWTKEDKKRYNKEYFLKNREKHREYCKDYYLRLKSISHI